MMTISGLAINIIELYQRRVSPYKGFRCAYSVRHDSAGCSGYALRALRSSGLAVAAPKVWRRLLACKSAARHMQATSLDSGGKRSDERRPPTDPDAPLACDEFEIKALKHAGFQCAGCCFSLPF